MCLREPKTAGLGAQRTHAASKFDQTLALQFLSLTDFVRKYNEKLAELRDKTVIIETKQVGDLGMAPTSAGGAYSPTQQGVFQNERYLGPKISFAEGGIVPGPIGQAVKAIVHGGETITPPGQSTASVYVSGNNFYVREEADIDRIGQAIVDKIRARTGVKI